MGTAVVTGASSGLGKELARMLAQRGERVLAVARNEGSLRDLASTSSRIEAVTADLSTPRVVVRCTQPSRTSTSSSTTQDSARWGSSLPRRET